ncbi:Conserved hypothetical protein [Shewanella piezotolerans WP3]|uniref:DUF2059 domain-containing protein n=1 Tax=Shewanella piezotolerans (strain WP3 / JCM 13877) TaxID=225849 RepID=B8CV34_SHEPW|nr:DUF2059 domain-containing protein [Shewanella piezotolerans]ACJ31510.1 Conserved hypothetical protein [Shewanella piezotolerans WP3]
MNRLWILLLVFIANIGFANEDSKQRQASSLLDAINAKGMLLQAQYKLQAQYTHLLKDYQIPKAKRSLEQSFREQAFNFSRKNLSWKQLEPAIIEAYCLQYTEAELAQLTAFFSSEVGQKFLTVQPQLAGSVDQLVNQQVILINNQFSYLIEEFVLQAGLTQPSITHHETGTRLAPHSRPIAPPSKPTKNITQ